MSALGDAIFHVVAQGAWLEVRGVAASRVVARMEDAALAGGIVDLVDLPDSIGDHAMGEC